MATASPSPSAASPSRPPVSPEIVRAGDEIGAMLAISLHATTDAVRDRLVPLNRKYPIEALLSACRAYPGLSNARRITFEYVMLKGVNDGLEDAKRLVKLLKGIPAKVNLIPFNPWPGSAYECSDGETIERFAAVLNRAGYKSPVRTPAAATSSPPAASSNPPPSGCAPASARPGRC